MRIANWNLQRVLPSQRRVASIREHIATVDADLWILTETHEDVLSGSGFNCVFSGEPDRPGKPGEHWVAICSRGPIEPLDDYVHDTARCAAARMVDDQLGEIIVVGLVLPWVGSSWRGVPSRNNASFTASLVVLSLTWSELRRDYPDATMIVAGDFNQSMVDWHYYGSRRRRALLEEMLSAYGLKVLTAGEGDPIARESAPCACIDHICIRGAEDIRVAATSRWPDTSKPDKRLSDHFGVHVDLEPQ